jgi:hypothetical protein
MDPSGDQDDEDRMASIWRQKPRDKNKFKRGRKGDHLMVQFECDFCIFAKLKERPPVMENATDRLGLACIRRANLDAFWSRAESTVAAHARHIKEGVELSEFVGIEPPYVPVGPLPSTDHCGYAMAILTLLKSRQKGKYHSSHQQWETIRKFRTAFGNQIRAGAAANSTCLSMGDAEGKSYSRLCADPCSSLWFKRFMTGCQRRMGQDWRPDRAITNKMLHFMLAKIEHRLDNASDAVARRSWIFAGGYFVLAYVNSLRGPDGLLLEVKGCLKHLSNEGVENYVVFALLGTVKGEHLEREHLLPTVNVTQSGIPVRRSLKRILGANRMCGCSSGPAFCDESGTVLTSQAIPSLSDEAIEGFHTQAPTDDQETVEDTFFDMQQEKDAFYKTQQESDEFYWYSSGSFSAKIMKAIIEDDDLHYFDSSDDTSDKPRFGKAFHLSIDYDSFSTPQDEDHVFTRDASVTHILQEMTMEEIFGYIPSETTFDTYAYAL